MDFATLKTTLESHIQSNEGENPSLSLSADALGTVALEQLLTTYADGTLTLVNLKPAIATANTMTLRGEGTGLFDQMPVTARFTVENAAPALLLTATAPPEWLLSDSFAVLEDTVLPLLEFADVTLTLASEDFAEAEGQPAYAAGLNFLGNLRLTGLLSIIGWILGDRDQIDLSGAIDLQSGQPILTFVKQLPGVSLGFLPLPSVTLAVQTEVADGALHAGIFIHSGIAFSTQGKARQIPISTEIILSALTTRFSANLDGFLDVTLDALSSLVNGVDLASALPSGLSIADAIALKDLVLDVNLSQRSLETVRLGVETTQPWELAADIAIKALRLNFQVDQPTTQKRLSMLLTGELFDAGLQVNAAFPNFRVFGGLPKDSALSLDKLLSELIPNLPETSNNLEIALLNFVADPTNKQFSLEGEVHNDWAIPLEVTELKITSLYFLMERINREFGVTLTGRLSLFSKEFLLIAERPTGLNSRWKFSGGLSDTDKISLKETIKTLIYPDQNVDDSALSLPFSSTDLEISELKFSVDTGLSKRYTFRGGFEWILELDSGERLTVKALLDIDSQLVAGTGTGTGTGAGTGTVARRRSKGTVTGQVSFENIDSEFFQNISMSVAYEFDNSSVDRSASNLLFHLQKDTLELNVHLSRGTGQDTILAIDFGNTNFGDVLKFMASLVDPDAGDFQLDPPWDGLNTLSLSGLVITINITRREVSFLFPISGGGLDLGFVNLQKLGLKYHKPQGKPILDVVIVGRILSDNYPEARPKSWDALNSPPPEVPGQGATVFDLRYLGVGQHVSFPPEQVAELTNVTQIIEALKARVRPPALPADRSKNPLEGKEADLQFNAESGWLIGAQFSLLDTLDLSVIFNDPLVYGIRIGLRGAKAKIFAGLVFEILYRRINDHIGVYHIELVLPDAMRQFQVGVVAITLPTLVLDIYTNGDFKIDLGFPWREHFARSFAIEAFIFIGSGGFYFNKLSAETATSTPIITNGQFNPVLEFGIGLKLGVGRTFRKGPLNAEISITIQGIIQGVFAWYHPTDANQPNDLYFRIEGSMALVGRLYGSVDFEIIQVEVEVIVRVMVAFVVESYQPTVVTLAAEVSVRASVKILFIRVSFTFSLTVTQKFVLGSASRTPWVLSPDQSKRRLPANTGTSSTPIQLTAAPFAMPLETGVGPMAEFAARESGDLPNAGLQDAEMTTEVAATASTTVEIDPEIDPRSLHMALADLVVAPQPTPLNWQAIQVLPAVVEIALYFQPAFSRSDAGLQSIALLMIENSIAVNSPGHEAYAQEASQKNSAFDALAQALLRWAIYAYYSTAGSSSGSSSGSATGIADSFSITRVDLEKLYDMIVDRDEADAAPFGYAQLLAFLAQNFRFRITNQPPDKVETLSGAIFPMFPALMLQLGSDAPVSFSDARYQLNAADRQDLIDYFRQLKSTRTSTLEPLPATPPAPASADPVISAEANSVAGFVFADYFALVLRTTVQDAIALLEDQRQTQITLGTLLQDLNTGGQFNHLAALVSRFLLHGLRLPQRDGLRNATPDHPTLPLYAETGQQVALAATNLRDDFAIGLRADAAHPTPAVILPAAGISYFLTTDHRALAAQLVADATSTRISAADFLPLNPQILSPYKSVRRHFNLQQKTAWRLPSNQVVTLIDFPDALKAYLETQAQANSSNPAGTRFDLRYGRPEGDRTDLQRDRAVTQYTWATKVTVNLRRVPNADGTALLENIYLITGLNEADKDRLEVLWTDLQRAQEPPQLFWLYSAVDRQLLGGNTDNAAIGGLTHQLPNAASFILKTNLATYTGRPAQIGTTQNGAAQNSAAQNASRPSSLYSAPLPTPSTSDVANILQLLWEGSTVNSGGYFLRFAVGAADSQTGLPDYIFTDGLNAALVLLIQPLPLDFDRARSFQNCLILRETLDLDQGVLFAESADTVATLSIPPGNIGFQLDRRNASSDSTDGPTALESLYHLLAYRLLETPRFNACYEGLPLGPADNPPTRDDASANNQASNQQPWHYERIMPIYEFAKPESLASAQSGTAIAAQSANLPAARANPYVGIAPDANVLLDFHWQDLYGNRLRSQDRPPLAIPVRYFDPLQGINQWPAVVESYQFQPLTGQDAADVALHLELVFDQAPYSPIPGRPLSETQRKAETARLSYQQIYYQIHQPDVRFTVHTSVIPDWQHEFAAAEQQRLTDFVESAYRYLAAAAALELYVHDRRTGETLSSLADQYYVTVAAIAEANAAAPNFYAVGTALEIPLDYKIQSSDTFSRIAQQLFNATDRSEAEIAQAIQAKLEYIARVNASQRGLLQPNANITLNGTVYTISSEDTLATLADRVQTTAPTTPATTPLMIVQALQNQTGILLVDALLAVVVDYKTQAGDSLNTMVEKVQILAPDRPIKVADIAQKYASLALTLDRLQIPERVVVPAALGMQISATPTLASITATWVRQLPSGQFSVADVAIANQSVLGLIQPNVSLLAPGLLARDLNQRSSANLTEADWQQIIDANLITRPNETLYTLTTRLLDVLTAHQKVNPIVTVADLALAVSDRADLLVGNQILLPPPLAIHDSTAISLPLSRHDATQTLRYPRTSHIFPVTVQVAMTRASDRTDATLRQTVPEIQQVTAFLSPKTTAIAAAVVGTTPESQIASLTQFATDFEAAFPELHVAVGNELPHSHSTSSLDRQDDATGQINRPLWAVHLGPTGMDYRFDPQDDDDAASDRLTPFFFAPAPLSNRLLAGSIALKSYVPGTGLAAATVPQDVTAIDLNALARDFLVAVEEFLEPAIAVPARLCQPAAVTTILRAKEILADAIHHQVAPILEPLNRTDLAQRRQVAADALRQQLLTNLVEGYDIETIVQYRVSVSIANVTPTDTQWRRELAPRLVGQPVVRQLVRASQPEVKLDPQEYNFSLSPAKLPLSPRLSQGQNPDQYGSYLTFFFDTKTPEKFEDIQLDLTYQVKEVEYDIQPVTGISDYQASSWLSFIRPIRNTDSVNTNVNTGANTSANSSANTSTLGRDLGTVQPPIPLRTYPMPPSLVLHNAEPDPDSITNLAKVREWQYTFVYEHLDIAQDAIESVIDYNVASILSANPTGNTNVAAEQRDLFAALVNFSQLYPKVLVDLQRLTQANPEAAVVNAAIATLATLITDVANAWQSWRQTVTPVPSLAYGYDIGEENTTTADAANPSAVLATKTVTIAISAANPRQTLPILEVPGYSRTPQGEEDQQRGDRTITYHYQKKSPEAAALEPIFGESAIPDRIFQLPDLDILHQQNAWAAIWLTRNRNLVSDRTTNPAFVYQTPLVSFHNVLTPLLTNRVRWNIATGSPTAVSAATAAATVRLPLAIHLQNLFTTLLPVTCAQPYDLRVACNYAFALAIGPDPSQDLVSSLPVLLSPRFSVPANQSRETLLTNLIAHLVPAIQAWQTDNQPVATRARFIFSVSLFANIASATGTTGVNLNLPLLKIEYLELFLDTIQ